jgi:hypothetical protein
MPLRANGHIDTGIRHGRFTSFQLKTPLHPATRHRFRSGKAAANADRAESRHAAGQRFVASEYTTGKTHGGRIDTLGLDETTARSSSSTSVRSRKTSSIRGCFTGLADGTIAEFKLLVLERFDKATADAIDWSGSFG